MTDVIPWCNESLAIMRDELTGKSQQLRCAVVRSIVDEALIYRKANEFALADGRYLFTRSVDPFNRTSRGTFHLRGSEGALAEVGRYCTRSFEHGWLAYVGFGVGLPTLEKLGSYSHEIDAMDALWERLPHMGEDGAGA